MKGGGFSNLNIRSDEHATRGYNRNVCYSGHGWKRCGTLDIARQCT